MTRLVLSLALTANNRTQPIIDGTVRPDGIDLTAGVRNGGRRC